MIVVGKQANLQKFSTHGKQCHCTSDIMPICTCHCLLQDCNCHLSLAMVLFAASLFKLQLHVSLPAATLQLLSLICYVAVCCIIIQVVTACVTACCNFATGVSYLLCCCLLHHSSGNCCLFVTACCNFANYLCYVLFLCR